LACLGRSDLAIYARDLRTCVPAIRFADKWAEGLRTSVRSSTAEGWSVREHRGAIRLEVRAKGVSRQSVVLPFDWAKGSVGDALTRVRNIYKLVASEGYSLKQAAEVAAGKAPKLIEQLDWSGAVERFKDQKLHHGTVIKPATWDSKYVPVLSDAVALLTGKDQPTSPAELIDRCIRSWASGSRTRQERARNLCQFLRYCVAREQFPAIWQPPIDLKDHIGRKPPDATSQKSDPITDQQILDLLASFPDDGPGRRWADAIRLLAELGLRPIELLHLSVKTDRKTGEAFWWCSYEKRAGGGVTRPRRLEPLPLKGDDGEVQQWDLMQRWKAGEIDLPPLSSTNGVAEAIKTYLGRRAGWIELRGAVEANGERVSVYSFRHSFSVRGHQLGIDSGAMALAMGHSLETHCRSYPWATESGAASAFKKARSRA